MQFSNLLKLPLEWKTKQLNEPGNYRELRETGVAFGRIIYTFFTGLSKAIYMFFTTEDTVKVRKIIYRFLHALQIMIVEKDNVNQYLQNIYMLYQKLQISCKFILQNPNM